MSVLEKWVNPYYLRPEVKDMVRESILAKPTVKYTVLDNFFNVDAIDSLIAAHDKLEFNEEVDRRARDTGAWLPYDGAVVFARKGTHVGSDLFYDKSWHEYLCYVTDTKLSCPAKTDIKLRYHRSDADGFWIHTDSVIRSMVAICYFNKDWKHTDGGLLQLWHVDDADKPNTFTVNNPQGRMDFLTNHKRIRTGTPGGGFSDRKAHDLILIDQVIPAYNRLFLCNFQKELAYHSVTPSNGKVRLGFVQWLIEPEKP
jgi:hypothetical protein